MTARYILGLKASGHESTVSVIDRDGTIVFALEEERMNRVKHGKGFIGNALRCAMKDVPFGPEDVECAAFPFDPPRLNIPQIEVKAEHFNDRYREVYRKRLYHTLLQSRDASDMNKRALREVAGFEEMKIVLVNHHLAHAASAFYPSGFSHAAVYTVDGSGDLEQATICVGDFDNGVRKLESRCLPHSLGFLYTHFTRWLGLGREMGNEGKTMGLSSYGTPRYSDLFHENVVRVDERGDTELNMELFVRGYPNYTDAFLKLFGQPRKPDEELSQFHKDVAATLQHIVETAFIRSAKHARKLTGANDLCLAGGVAMNSLANGRVIRECGFENVFIQPGATDNGSAYGAALYVHYDILGRSSPSDRRSLMRDPYLGPEYSQQEIEETVKRFGYPVDKVKNPEEWAAKRIANGSVVGWFQGRIEVGARALGNRSILADPRFAATKDTVNNKVKFREPWRPFAPVVLYERCDEYFQCPGDYPFMTVVQPVVEEKAGEMEATSHVDNTARLQTIKQEQNPMYYRVIHEFGKITGTPVLMNTSFNVRGEPIVCSPKEAIKCWRNTGMDDLVMGRCVLTKEA